MFSQMNQAQPVAPGSQGSHIVETLPLLQPPTRSQMAKQFELAANPAVKIWRSMRAGIELRSPNW